MLVKEIIKGIEEKTLTNAGLAKQYGVTGKTISNRIKKLGFKWHPSSMKYEFVGEDLESTLNTSWDYLFDVRTTDAIKTKKSTPIKTEQKTISKQPDSKQQQEPILKAQSAPKRKNLDKIDMLLRSDKDKQKKVYRGFYFEQDIIDIVDKAGDRNKSELINECLRAVFEEKGLL